MNKLFRDFISAEKRVFEGMLGKTLASALSGLIAGVIITAIILGLGFYLYRLLVVG